LSALDYGDWSEFMLMDAAQDFVWVPIYGTYPESPLVDKSIVGDSG